MPIGPSARNAGNGPEDGTEPEGAGLTAYFNGEHMPLDEMAQAMKEAGLESAGGFYDVERTFGGTLYRLDDHLARLYRGLEYSGINPGVTREQMASLTTQLVSSNLERIGLGQDLLVTQIVSVGTAADDTDDSGDGRPVSVAIYCQILDPLPFALSYGYGIRVVTPTTYAVPPVARPRRQLSFPLMNDAEGNITECQGGNFMFVRDGRIKLPDRSNVLAGVSMKAILDLAEGMAIGVDEDDFCTGDVYLAEEAFVSSTRFCMLPVATVNGLGIGAELPGPVTRRLLDAWIEEASFDFVKQALDQAAGAGMI